MSKQYINFADWLHLDCVVKVTEQLVLIFSKLSYLFVSYSKFHI